MTRYLGDDFLLPNLTPRNTAFFTAGSVQIQSCEDCSHTQHPPDDVCYACQGTKLAFRSMPGTGRVESSVVVHISVDGAPGCSVTGNVGGCAPEAGEIGARVQAVFEEVEDPRSGETLKIPQWELSAD